MKRDIEIGDRTFAITSDDQYLAKMPARFEPHMTDLFRALIRPDMVVADVGGNIGMTALLFSQLAREVHAFEPGPSTFALLEANLAAADVRNVTAHRFGMGDARSQQTLTFASSNRSGGFVSDTIRPEAGYTTETIEIETLDSFYFDAAAAARPDFIKMDVEGFEPRVLRGGQALLAVKKPIVVLELNHFCLNVLHRVTLPEFFDQLRAIFPVLLAVDNADPANSHVANLHNRNVALMVMHKHAIRFRYPNIVAGFDPDIAQRLNALLATAAA